MAEKQAGGLSLRIGLTLNQLQSDFLAAEQTVKQGIAALNRQQNIIRLKMETDTAGLDALTEKTKILEVQERAITQLLAMQRDKLTLATKAYQDYANSKNANAVVAKNLETSMERERLAVARLEAQLKSLSAQQVIINTTKLQDSIAQLNSKIQHVKIQAELDVSKLQGANAAFDAQKIHIAAVTKEIELQRQKLVQLQETMYRSAKLNGGDSSQTLTFKTNVLQQIQEIQKLENKLKELQNTKVDLQIRADTFRQAESQIHEKISLLNAKLEHVKVKTDIDLSSLSPMASEFDKAKAHVHNLNQELTLQNQKLAEMRKLLSASISANGLNNVKTINLQTEIQKQIQAIDQLKAKINELNKIQPPKTNNLLSGYLNIKGETINQLNQLSSAFNGIKAASQSADGAITKSLDIIGAIPSPVGKAVAALAAIPLVIKGIESSLLEMAKPAIAGGDAFYVMSRGMQLSIADMGKLSTIAKVTGIDINEVNSSLRRFSAQMTKAGEKNNVAAQVMKRYGAEVYDANGRVKNAIELSAELGKALKKAQEEGNGAAFRDLVGGRFWSADFITYLEDFADNIEQAKKVVKNGLANPTWAHAIQGEINTLNAQVAQLGGAFSAALMPVVAEIVPKMREQFGELTKVIAANKENIKFLGDAMALPVRMLNEFTGGIIKLSNAIDTAKDKESTLGKVFESYGKYRDDLAALMNVAPTVALTAILSPGLGETRAAIEAYRKEIDEFQKERAKIEDEAAKKNEERQKRIESSLGLSGLTMEQAQQLEATSKSLNEQRIKWEQEAADTIYKINHDSYENRLRDLKSWKAEQLRVIIETEEKIKDTTGQDSTLTEARIALERNYSAKVAEIAKEREDKLKEIRSNVEAADKTALQNKIDNIEKERQAWTKAGMDEAEATELAQKKISQVRQEAAQKAQEYFNSAADIEFNLTHSALEKQFRDIDKWKDAQLKKAETAEEVAGIIRNAAAKEAEAFESSIDRIKGKLQTLDDKIFAQEHSQYENDLRRIEQERVRYYQDFAKEGMLNIITQEKIEHWFANAERELRGKAAEARKTENSDYTKRPNGSIASDIPLLADDSLIRYQLELNRAMTKIDSTAGQGLPSIQDLGKGAQETSNELTRFDSSLSQLGFSASELNKQQAELINSTQVVTEAQRSFVENVNSFMPGQFKNLADSLKNISEVQSQLTKSTLELISAQEKLSSAFANMNFGKSAEITQKTPDEKSEIVTKEISDTKNNDWNFFYKLLGIGNDEKKVVSGEQSTIDFSELTTPLNAIDENTQSILRAMQDEQPRESDQLQELFGTLPNIEEYTKSILTELQDKAATDFSELVTPLTAIDENVQSVLREMQSVKEMPSTPETQNAELADYMTPLTSIDTNVQSLLQQLQTPAAPAGATDYLTPLNNIDGKIQSVLLEMQSRQPVTLETVVTPLNNIEQALGNIATALSNQQPPQINISPNNNVNLGGAYVFDNALKTELVNDITSQIVDKITAAVQQATSRSSFGYGS